jgi:carotenoid cleavage dioxygenase
MIHQVEFDHGKARYQNRLVRTKVFVKDGERGESFGDFGSIAIADFEHMAAGRDENGEVMGRANTALVHHAGKSFALFEGDKPYAIDLQDLSTDGRYDFQGNLKHNVTAHPRVDFETGELFMFCYSIGKPPFLQYAVSDPEGRLVRSFPIQIPCASMMHDFVITEKYAVFLNCNMEFDMQVAMKGKSPWQHRREKPARFGILPRLATSDEQIRWIDVDPCFVVHFANAWEEGDDIVVMASRYRTVKFGAQFIDDPADFGRLYCWRLSLKTGQCVKEAFVGNQLIDFPQFDVRRTGRRNNFVYAAKWGSPSVNSGFDIKGVLKYDTEKSPDDGNVQEYTLPEGYYGGEAVFAPREGQQSEDNGYVLMFAIPTDGASESFLHVLRAEDLSLQCKLRMPRRVPMGFHSYWKHDL